MSPVELKPAIPASEQQETHPLDGAATGITKGDTKDCTDKIQNIFFKVICTSLVTVDV